MDDVILSAGIDIGTSTTQLIFSKLTLANTGGFGSVPKIEVIKKEVFYRSEIHFTPLIDEEIIDAAGVKALIEEDYRIAGITPDDLSSGAVIITGETVRKRNAREVLGLLSDLAGDFVVSAAGPDLESVLSGKGSGAAKLSKDTGKLIANLDIGGGTTNISFFENGEIVDTACLNIGGRLIKLDESGRINYISKAVEHILKGESIELSIGDNVHEDVIDKRITSFTDVMTKIIFWSIGLWNEAEDFFFQSITNHGISCGRIPDAIVFSGGVADCISKDDDGYPFGDIGLKLGHSVRKFMEKNQIRVLTGEETVNATVVGAGNYSMEVSGSTIHYQSAKFPMKNIPVYSLRLVESEDINFLYERLSLCKNRAKESELHGTDIEYIVAMEGIPCPSFKEIEEIAGVISTVFEEEIKSDHLPPFVMESDVGKVLGQAVRRRIGRDKSFICIDRVCCKEGDFIDIGKPIANGTVIPVVVKTLIFE